MKSTTILKHYLPCLYFIFLALCMLFVSNTNPVALLVLAIFSVLLFVRHSYVRMAAGLLMLFLSLYFSLAWMDEVQDIRAAGGLPTLALRLAIWYIAGAFCMAVLLIVPLQLPKRAPLYNRK